MEKTKNPYSRNLEYTIQYLTFILLDTIIYLKKDLLKGGKAMATIKDVAKRSGVTATTVSRMLNNKANVSNATRAKIEQAMAELNYCPNEIARALSAKRSNIIGLIVPAINNPYFGQVIDAVERHASKNGYKLMLCNSNQNNTKELEYFEMLEANRVAGVIIASHTPNLGDRIRNNSMVISIDRVISDRIPYICSDNYQGGVLATEHLIQRGCTKLAHISGSSTLNMDANKRCKAFKDVCQKYGVDYVVLDASEEQFLAMDYSEIIDFLFTSHPDVDGVFTSNDILAAQVIQSCVKRGVCVPGQLKVVGYDDIELCKLCTPTITTIHQSVGDICHYAVESIINNSRFNALPKSIIFGVTLVQRGST